MGVLSIVLSTAGGAWGCVPSAVLSTSGGSSVAHNRYFVPSSQ